jgi:Brp/Blh family beta-carotene 15,15'-monooxygenase
MKTLFAWCPLAPPAGSSRVRWIESAARLGMLGTIGGGVLQVSLGWSEGPALFLPLIASALIFGLPHGAVDHLVVLGLAGLKLQPRALAVVCGIYLLLAVLFASLWVFTPSLAVVAFLLMTIYHWGWADTAYEITCRSSDSLGKSPGLRLVHSALRGFIPIGLPFLSFPQETGVFVQSCVAIFADEALPTGPWENVIAAALGLLFCAELAFLLRQRGTSGRGRMLFETMALIGFFSLVPPLIAIGWYFCLWHGLRHVLRLCRYADRSGEGESSPRALLLFFRRALPFTLASVGLLLLAALFLPVSENLSDWIALYLVLISALTFPHVLLVKWMDHREWQSGEAGERASFKST